MQHVQFPEQPYLLLVVVVGPAQCVQPAPVQVTGDPAAVLTRSDQPRHQPQRRPAPPPGRPSGAGPGHRSARARSPAASCRGGRLRRGRAARPAAASRPAAARAGPVPGDPGSRTDRTSATTCLQLNSSGQLHSPISNSAGSAGQREKRSRLVDAASLTADHPAQRRVLRIPCDVQHRLLPGVLGAPYVAASADGPPQAGKVEFERDDVPHGEDNIARPRHSAPDIRTFGGWPARRARPRPRVAVISRAGPAGGSSGLRVSRTYA